MSGTHGVFQHRTGYFYTILEEDFCEVYKAPGANEVCRAYITSILEHLTNKQFEATGRDSDIWVFMSLPEMERRMRHACSQRTIHKELQSMVKEGFLFKRRAIGKATMEYKLNLKKLRKALEALPEVQSSNSARYNLANLQDQSSNSARLILQNDKKDLANLQPRIHREEERDYTEITEESALVAASPSSNEDARALEHENNNHSYRHDHTRTEDAWNCENWCRAHEKTCSDYQAWIESGGRETPTEPRVEAVKIGATDDSPMASHTPVSAPGDTSGSAGIPAPVLDRGSVRRDGISLEESQQPTLRAAGATQPQVAIASTPKQGDILAVRMQDGTEALAQVEHFEGKQHMRVNWLEPCGQYIQAWRDTGGGISHPYESTLPAQPDTNFTYHGIQAFGDYRVLTSQERAAITVKPLYLRHDAIASIPGEPDSPPALSRQSQTTSSQGPDGAATGGTSSEPRASHGDVTQESILADWAAIQGRPQSRTDRLLKAAREGVEANPSRDELKGCRDWLPTTDNPKTLWYHKRGVELWDVIEKLGAYRSYLALSIEPAPLADVKQPKPMDVYTAYSLDTERSDRNLEKLRAKRLAREAAQQGGAGI